MHFGKYFGMMILSSIITLSTPVQAQVFETKNCISDVVNPVLGEKEIQKLSEEANNTTEDKVISFLHQIYPQPQTEANTENISLNSNKLQEEMSELLYLIENGTFTTCTDFNLEDPIKKLQNDLNVFINLPSEENLHTLLSGNKKIFLIMMFMKKNAGEFFSWPLTKDIFLEISRIQSFFLGKVTGKKVMGIIPFFENVGYTYTPKQEKEIAVIDQNGTEAYSPNPPIQVTIEPIPQDELPRYDTIQKEVKIGEGKMEPKKRDISIKTIPKKPSRRIQTASYTPKKQRKVGWGKAMTRRMQDNNFIPEFVR